MENYKDLITRIKKLNNCRKKILLADIYKMIYKTNVPSRDLNLICPFCGHKHIVKNGKNKDKQRYLCKNCLKSFILDTNTPVYYSKKKISLWVDFLDCLYKQYSIRKTAKALHICSSTAFFWRHKILDAIRIDNASFSENNKLEGTILCEEFSLKESFKGNHSKSSFTMPRCPYNKKLSPINEFGKRKVSVLIASDSKNQLLSPVSIGRPTSNDIIRFLNNKIQKESVLMSDKSISSFDYKIASGFLSLNYLENESDFSSLKDLSSQITNFLAPYSGVATKYLANYLSLFKKMNDYSKKAKNNNNHVKKEDIQIICPLFIKSIVPYYLKYFKNRLPAFE